MISLLGLEVSGLGLEAYVPRLDASVPWWEYKISAVTIRKERIDKLLAKHAWFIACLVLRDWRPSL